jgi:putative DNA primase/helicase
VTATTDPDLDDFMRATREGPRRGKANGHAGGEPAARELRVLAAADFLALEIPEREMLLDPVLPARGLAMLFAPRGVGKTHVALSAAYAVASGGALFRWRAPVPRPVVYVDAEMPARTMQERLAAIVNTSGAEPPDG